MTEYLEIEELGHGGRPEPKCVDRLATITNHRAVVGNAAEIGRFVMDNAQAPALYLARAVQLSLHLLLTARNFPGVWLTKPIVRLFILPTVLDGLAEYAVF